MENSDEKHEKKPVIIRSSVDLQRLKLEKLMANPEKPVIIPERPKERGVPIVPDFVRNVMGSSAGAGSGEFHVYRHLRRKEYARQKYMKEKAAREKLDDDYHQKLEENKKKAEDQTAKRRQKRQKKKRFKKQKSHEHSSKPDSSSEESEDDDIHNSDENTVEELKEQKCESKDTTENESCEITNVK